MKIFGVSAPGLFYGLGSSSGSGLGVGSVIVVLLVIAAFALSIVAYIKLAGANAGSSPKRSWSWQRFFQFDTIMVSGILKYLYILSAFEILAFGLGLLVMFASTGAIVALLIGLLLAVLFIAINELLCRMSFEFLMLQVKLTENSAIIRDAVAGADGAAPGGSFGGFAAGGSASAGEKPTTYASAGNEQNAAKTSPSNAAAVPVASTSVGHASSGASSSRGSAESWVCPQCGRVNTHGGFCGGCGMRRS